MGLELGKTSRCHKCALLAAIRISAPNRVEFITIYVCGR